MKVQFHLVRYSYEQRIFASVLFLEFLPGYLFTLSITLYSSVVITMNRKVANCFSYSTNISIICDSHIAQPCNKNFV